MENMLDSLNKFRASLDKQQEVRNDDKKRSDNREKSNKDSHHKKNNHHKDNKRGNRSDLIERATRMYVERRRNTIDDIEEFKRALQDKRFREDLSKFADNSDDINTKANLAALIFEITINGDEHLKDYAPDLISIVDELNDDAVKATYKAIKKKHRPSKEVIEEVISVVPSLEIVNPNRNIFELVHAVNSKLYKLSEEISDGETIISRKGIKALYKEIFGEDNITKCAVGCLLERREMYHKYSKKATKDLWTDITEFALDTLDSIENEKRVVDLLRMYISKRKFDNKDSARRVNMKEINSEYAVLRRAVQYLLRDQSLTRYLGA